MISIDLEVKGERASLSDRFAKAIAYFRERGRVIFVNESVHFWEKHGFVQQSLAKLLTENEIPVLWYDHFGWREYQPTLHWTSPYLEVSTVRRLPGDRFLPIKRLNDFAVAGKLSRQMTESDTKAVLWVHASLNEEVAKQLPWIDLYSMFDDPYRHSPADPLMSRARLITCQNRFAFERTAGHFPEKTLHLLPPFEAPAKNNSNVEPLSLPSNFPKKVMGYIGSFTGDATDFAMVQSLLTLAPDWGIILAGRTDSIGQRWIESLKRFPNFLCLDWMPPHRLASVWKAIDVTILPYRQARINDGAFPVKLLESLSFNIPAVGTRVYKNSSLEGIIPLENFPDRFLKAVEEEARIGKQKCQALYESLSAEMNPRLHLIQVAEALSKTSS